MLEGEGTACQELRRGEHREVLLPAAEARCRVPRDKMRNLGVEDDEDTECL